MHTSGTKTRLATVAPLAILFSLCCSAQTCFATDGKSLFFMELSNNDTEWTEIAPSAAVRLVDEVVAKQPKYGSARAQFLIYLANDFTYDRDDLVELFRAMKETDSPSKLREKTDPIWRRRPNNDTQKLNWSAVTITEDGDDLIEKNEKWSSDTQSSVYLSTDEVKVIYEGTIRQADVALPGMQNRILINSLAHFHVRLKPVNEHSVISAAKSSGYVKLVRGTNGVPGRTTVISLDMGSVIHDYTTSPDGALIEETWQGPVKVWPGEVPYPTSQLHFRLVDGEVTYVRAVITKQAEFNVRIAPSAFVVSVPAGTTVVDVRSGEPAVARVSQPVDDLVKSLADGLSMKVVPGPNGLDNADAKSKLRWNLILINVIAVGLLLIIILVMRRRRLGSV